MLRRKQLFREKRYSEFSASISTPIFFSSISPFLALMIPWSIRSILTAALSMSSTASTYFSSLSLAAPPVKLAFDFEALRAVYFFLKMFSFREVLIYLILAPSVLILFTFEFSRRFFFSY